MSIFYLNIPPLLWQQEMINNKKNKAEFTSTVLFGDMWEA